MRVHGGRWGGVLLVCITALAAGCDGAVTAPQHRESDHPASALQGTPPAPIACEDVNETNTPEGPARIRFARILLGMMPDECGRVVGPDAPLRFARYLQSRLELRPGCAQCQISRVDEVAVLNVELQLLGQWRKVEGEARPSFFTFMPDDLDVASNRELQLEGAHYYFVRDGQSYEAFEDALCPGSNPDPGGPGPRRVSDECLVLHEEPAPHIQQPGLWEDAP